VVEGGECKVSDLAIEGWGRGVNHRKTLGEPGGDMGKSNEGGVGDQS